MNSSCWALLFAYILVLFTWFYDNMRCWRECREWSCLICRSEKRRKQLEKEEVEENE